MNGKLAPPSCNLPEKVRRVVVATWTTDVKLRLTHLGYGQSALMALGSGRETGSWSELAKQDATLPADAKDLTAKSNGMLGFFNRKKGRGHSPKPQERGILGKEGARVVISG